MTRKRGKTRTSYPTRRLRRFETKYSVDALTHRAKKLLPVMYPHLRVELINWDYLEVLLFPKFIVCGIAEEDYDFYLAYAKRKAELGLKVNDLTWLAEVEALKAEFVARGLDPAKLSCVDATIDYWVSLIRREVVDLIVDSFYLGYYGDWVTSGANPWLHTNDGDTSYIESRAGSFPEICCFRFPNLPSGFDSVSKVESHIYHRKAGAFDPTTWGYFFNGVSWVDGAHLTAVSTGYVETVNDITSILDTPAKVNGTEVYFRNRNNDYHRLSYCFLRVFK